MGARVTVIDCGGGNVGSMARALARVGADVTVAQAGGALEHERLVLPGVGHFGTVMQALRSRGLDRVIEEHVQAGRPFLGVCAGLQVLFQESEEAPGVPGLGLVPGGVSRFRHDKVPQVGFNLVEVQRASTVLESGYFYFVNSYHVEPLDRGVVAATSDYGGPFVAAIERGNLVAVQFHPEKSAAKGLALLERWLRC